MGEDTKKVDGGPAEGRETTAKPWHPPRLRKIEPGDKLREVFEAMQGEPPKRERRALRRA